MGESTDVEVQVLGPAAVLRDGRPIDMRPRPLAVLVAAALSSTRKISVESLQEVFAPAEKLAGSTLRTYVSELRNELGVSIIPWIRNGTITLQLPKERIDYWRLNELLVGIRATPPEESVPLLRRARELWKPGTPLSNLRDVHVDAERARLDALRYKMFRDLVRAELAGGEDAEAVADAERAVALWPTDEAVAQDLWSALAQQGRTSEVRFHFERFVQASQRSGRKVPSSTKRAVNELIRTASSHSLPVIQVHSRTPRHIAEPETSLHGRDADLASLDTLVSGSDGPRVATVHGLPGVGKTLLAMSWAHRREEQFPDGTLHADLHGFADRPPQSVDDVLVRFIRSLGGNPAGASTDELAATYRTLLSELAVLVVLDNVRNHRQVRELIVSSARGRVVVTSRSMLSAPDMTGSVLELSLRPIAPEAGLAILAEAIGPRRVGDERLKAHDLIELCGGLPLALKLVATQARRRSSSRLATLVEELKARTELLDLGGDPGTRDGSLQTIIGWSIKALTSRAVLVLQVAALHPGPEIDLWVISYLSGLSRREARAGVDELLESNLVRCEPDERYALHDVIRKYAVELATSDDTDLDPVEVRESVLKHLLHSGAAADRALDSGRELPIGQPEDRMPIPDLPDGDAAMAWFELEYRTFVAVLESPEYAVRTEYRWMLPAVLCTFQNRAGHWRTAAELLKVACEVVREEPPCERLAWADALMHRLRGMIQRKLGQFELATGFLNRSVQLCREGGFRFDEAHAHQQLSVVHEEREQWAKALEHASTARDIYADFDDVRGVIHTTNALISADLGAGAPERAVTRGPEALAAAERTGDDYGRASVHRNLLRCYQAIGRHTEAVEQGEAAVAAYRGRVPANEAQVQERLAKSYRALARSDLERSALVRARDLLSPATIEKRDQDKERLARVLNRLSELDHPGC